MPDVETNSIDVDFKDVIKFMAENWDEPGKLPDPGENSYSIKESFIKMGQRLMDSNKEEMRSYEAR